MSISSDEAKKFAVNFLVSGTTAACCKTIVAPIDRVKLIIQNQDSALQVLMGTRRKYTGMLNVIMRLPKEQGFWSFWRGNGTNLVRYFPAQALNFSFKDLYSSKFLLHLPATKESNKRFIYYISGGLAGMSSTLILYPLEFCQTKLCVDVGSDLFGRKKSQREFTGLRDCLKKVYKRDGYKGLYRGMVVSVCGCGIYRSFYFGIYEDLKILKLYYDSDKNYSVFFTFLRAQTASALSGFISYPLDTIGRRLMMDSGRPVSLRLHKTFRSAVRHIYKQDGIYGFFKGWLANILRSFGGALVLVSYESILYFTNWKEILDRYNT